MKAKVTNFVPYPEGNFQGDNGLVEAHTITIDVNGQQIAYTTFAKSANVGEEIEYTTKDTQNGPTLKIVRAPKSYGKGGGKSIEQVKLEILGRACNQAAQLATKDGTFNVAVADRVLDWIKVQLNATAQAQQPVATSQDHNVLTEEGKPDIGAPQDHFPSEHDDQVPI